MPESRAHRLFRRLAAGQSRLRIRTLTILCVAFVIFALSQWFSARVLYDKSFAHAERRGALALARHAQTIVNYPIGYLYRTVIDNAMWDDTYNFMAGRNPKHPESLLAMSDSFRMLRMTAYVLVDIDGSVKLARQFDARREKLIDADPAVVQAASPGGAIWQRLHPADQDSGYARVGGAIFSWSAAPVLRSDGSGPSNGWWVMLTALDDGFLAQASEAVGAHVALAVRAIAPGSLPPVHVPATSDEVEVSTAGGNLLESRLLLGKLDEDHAVELVVRSARDVHAIATRASDYLLWTTILFGTVLSYLALRFVERRVLRPLEAASRDLVRIGKGGGLSARLTPATRDDEIGRLVAAANDMLAKLERRHDVETAMLSAIPDALLRVDRAGIVLDCRLPDESSANHPWPAKGQTLASAFAPEASTCLLDALALAYATGTNQHVEYSVQTAHQRSASFEARVTRINGDESLVLIRDITARKEIESRVARLAFFDSLTQLPNRAAFMEQLGRQVRRAARTDTRFGLIYLDLDGFKQINDTMGHDRGDQVLLKTAERLKAALRATDTISRAGPVDDGKTLSRLGGDEFTMLISDIEGPEDVLAVAHRIGAVMRRPFEVEGHEFTLTTSIGVAVYPEDGTDAQTLLKNADTAMYHAKRQGRDNSQFYRAQLTEQAMIRLELENSLRGGLARGEFHLLYQPVIDMDSGRMAGVEALIRWEHPTRGAVSPSKFIPLAEENGSIGAIGQWVLESACRDLAAWRRAGLDLRLAVNVSPRQLADPEIVQSVLRTLALHDVPASRLDLEITEGAVMEAFVQTTVALNALRQHGMRIALDDFGTGYSSLGYLTQIPIDVIKIDRSFVRHLPQDSGSASIVRAILALAGALGFEVTAEGVETEVQAQELVTMSCRHVQGFYFSRPVASDQIPALARRTWCKAADASVDSSPIQATESC